MLLYEMLAIMRRRVPGMCYFEGKNALVVGTKQTVRALMERKVLMLYIAEDADEFIKAKLLKAAGGDVEIIYVPTMRELGRKCRIAVGTAVCGVLKQS